jgi:hypothetical protein
MRLWGLIVATVLGVVALSSASASEHRSRAVAREFQQVHPCPSTGRTSGACPGYVRDHVVPLGCGGPDAVANMQWQQRRQRIAGREKAAVNNKRNYRAVLKKNLYL